MKAIYKSDKGLVRSSNQDWVEVRNFEDSSCLSVVCDGVGGSAGGEIASKEAASTIVSYFEQHPKYSIKDLILESIKVANERIIELSNSNESISGLGTTSVVAFVEKNMLHVANVGDSRAYIISNEEIVQVTEDHSVVNELVNQGKITSEEAKNAPNKNIITRALGHFNSNADYYNRILEHNQKVLLCSDGLTNCLSDEEIKNIVIKNPPESAVDLLISESNAHGSPDNVTVSLIF